MGTIALLAGTLTNAVENQELCQAGVGFTSLRIRIQEIEIPSEGFHRTLRRPLTLRVIHELDYWIVSDFQTTVWGTDPTVGEALLDYMREWKEQLDWLETRRAEMGPGLIADYEKLLRLVA